MQTVVRSIDVGYGQTKFIRDVVAGQMRCEIFPSIAPTLTGPLLSDPLLQNTDIIKVEIGGVTRVVGKDAAHFQGSLSTRILDESYSGSESYMALTHGALYYMRQKYIDLLVVGLPVSIYKNVETRKTLERKLTGLHRVSNDFVVNVEKVKVMPQPLGGFFDSISYLPGYPDIHKQNTLIIDAGFHTFDFMVANGIHWDHQRNGAYHKCMGAVLASIAEGISSDPKVNSLYTDLQRIDDTLVGGDEFERLGESDKAFMALDEEIWQGFYKDKMR